MAVTWGFYNSVDGDRVYSAEQFSSLFRGIINDGIFQNIGNAFRVTVTTPNGVMPRVIIGPGRGWLWDTWIDNDGDWVLQAPFVAHTSLNRIDSIFIEVDKHPDRRRTRLRFEAGTPAVNPVAPNISNTSTMRVWRLANLRLRPNATSYLQADVTYFGGTAGLPFVTGPLQTLNISNWTNQAQNQFENWFNALGDLLNTNAEAALGQAILDLRTETERLDGVDFQLRSDIATRVSQHNILSASVRLLEAEHASHVRTTAGQINGIDTALASLANNFLAHTREDPSFAIRKNSFRGRSLGTQVTTAQADAIASGTFTGMWLGDYWTISGRVWRIVDFDYYYGINTGTVFNNNHTSTSHHVVLMPDNAYRNGVITSSFNDTNPGFRQSYARLNTLITDGDAITNQFGGTSARGVLVCADFMSDGLQSGGHHTMTNTSFRATLPTLSQIIGAADNAVKDDIRTFSTQQFALMRENRRYQRTSNGGAYWTRTIYNNVAYHVIVGTGQPSWQGPTTGYGLRPIICVGRATQ